MKATELTTDQCIDKAIRIMRKMIRSSRNRKIKILKARIALAELAKASKYTTPPDEDYENVEPL